MKDRKLRKMGIEVIGDAPWGTHFCVFYQTKEDLIDILVPYFRAGLENNEFCMWVTSEPLNVEDAERALQRVVKNLDDYIEKGQIEILDYSQWYTKSGRFDADKVLQGWVEKEAQAVKRGFDGLRLTGNTFWLEERDWEAFTNYEAEVDRVIGQYRMLAICTYSLDRCGAVEVIDVVSNHQFALIKQEGKWEIIESAERKRTEERLEHLNLVLRAIRSVNQLIVRQKDRDRLLRGVCDALIETRGYYNAWIALLDEAGRLVVTAEAGLGEGFTPLVEQFKRGELITCGRKALTQSGAVAIEDPFSTCSDCPLLANCGGRGALAIRLEHGGKVYGLLTASIPAHLAADREEQSLFEEVARDIVFALHDIELEEEHRRAEKALRKSQQLLQRTFASLLDAVFIIDSDTIEILDCNPAASEVFGYDRQEMLGRTTAFLHVDEDWLAEFRRHLYPAVEEKGFLFLPEFKMKRKNGEVFPTEHSVVPLEDEQGKHIGWVSVVRDITERKRAEEALRESREKYREIINGMNDTGWVIGFDGKFIDVNETAVRVLGYSREELLSMGPADIDSHLTEEQIKDLIRRMPSDEIQVFETEHTTKEGKTIPVEISSSLVTYQGRRAILSIARDITKRKRAEEEVRRHLEQVEALREIDKAVTSTLDLPRVLDIILQELERVIPYHSAGILLLSDGTAKLAAGRGFPDLERVLQVSFPVKEDPLTREVLQEKRPLVLADAQADERFLARGGTEYVRSWIGVPLIAKGRALGFLTVDHREPGMYDEQSAEIAQSFASQAAIAIENAQLYQEAQRELAERKRVEEELRQSYVKLQRALEGTVHVLASAVEMRDPYTAGHQRRVTQLAYAIANEMGLPQERCEGLRMAGLIHDIGKISVPAEILSKPAQLTELEYGLIKTHSQVGYDILDRATEFPWPVAQIVLQHHERMNGSGYPQGLWGEEIMLEARILAVADVVEAMASYRPYRPPHGLDKALEEISQNRGILYDHEVVDACLKLFTEKGFTFE